MIDSSILSPPIFTDSAYTTPFRDKIAISEVPPPISTTIFPLASSTGRPAPIAAAIGSSINLTSLAPAPRTDSLIALLSTWVDLQGTQTKTRGLGFINLCS